MTLSCLPNYLSCIILNWMQLSCKSTYISPNRFTFSLKMKYSFGYFDIILLQEAKRTKLYELVHCQNIFSEVFLIKLKDWICDSIENVCAYILYYEIFFVYLYMIVMEPETNRFQNRCFIIQPIHNWQTEHDWQTIWQTEDSSCNFSFLFRSTDIIQTYQLIPFEYRLVKLII